MDIKRPSRRLESIFKFNRHALFKRTGTVIGALCVLTAASWTFAKEPPTPKIHQSQSLGATMGPGQSMWLDPKSTFSLPSPPEDDRTDAARVEALKTERTPQRMREIIAQQPGAVGDFFQAAGFIPTQCPAQIYFATAIASDTVDVVFSAKRHFSRLRPHQVLADVKPAIEVPWHASYPSGHATQARLLARVFATWYPAKAATFAALARRVAENREVAGVHYPSDSAAGFLLGDQLFAAYQKNPQVREFLSRPCAISPMTEASQMREGVEGAVSDQQKYHDALTNEVITRLQLRMMQWQSAGDNRASKIPQ